MDQSAFDDRIAGLALRVDDWIRPHLQPTTPFMAPLYDMMAYHLGWVASDGSPLPRGSASGKRIRPILAMLVCEAVGGAPAAARGPAVAVELVHNFSLVHDDIQDVSKYRRGRETVWKLWGAAQAINVGDAIFALAQVALAEGMPANRRVGEALLCLNRTCVRLVEGQFMDLALESAADVTPSIYWEMIERKTAALIQCACELGALAADAGDTAVEACGRFGLELGTAFQLQDDLLGAWGDPAVTGKPSGDDIRSRKKSLPVVLALETASGVQRDRLSALLSEDRPLLDDEVGEALTLLDALGTRERAEAVVEGQFEAVHRALSVALPADRRGDLLELCERLRTRLS